MSCAKTAEAVKMQFEMLSCMGPGNIYYMRCRLQMPPLERALLGASEQLKNIVKYRILGLGKRVSCANNRWINQKES